MVLVLILTLMINLLFSLEKVCLALGAVHGQPTMQGAVHGQPVLNRTSVQAWGRSAQEARETVEAVAPECDKYTVRRPTHEQTFGICVLATLRYEAPYMLEWLTWHRLAGVHHVWMYLDESDLPGSQLTEHSELVEVMRSQEWITLITRRDGWDVLLEFKQGEVMRHCTLSAQGKVDWTSHWDVNEMLVIGPRLTPPIGVDLPLKPPSFSRKVYSGFSTVFLLLLLLAVGVGFPAACFGR